METKTLVGYVLKNSAGQVIDANGAPVEPSSVAGANPNVVPLPVAYGYISRCIAERPNDPPPTVEAVYNVRELTPLETTSRELGSLLMSLTKRHGLDLGLTEQEMTNQIAKELCDLAAKR